MGIFKNYHWNVKKLKKQANLGENGLELSGFVILFIILLHFML